jgi:hypothetical protein
MQNRTVSGRSVRNSLAEQIDMRHKENSVTNLANFGLLRICNT